MHPMGWLKSHGGSYVYNKAATAGQAVANKAAALVPQAVKNMPGAITNTLVVPEMVKKAAANTLQSTQAVRKIAVDKAAQAVSAVSQRAGKANTAVRRIAKDHPYYAIATGVAVAAPVVAYGAKKAVNWYANRATKIAAPEVIAPVSPEVVAVEQAVPAAEVQVVPVVDQPSVDQNDVQVRYPSNALQAVVAPYVEASIDQAQDQPKNDQELTIEPIDPRADQDQPIKESALSTFINNKNGLQELRSGNTYVRPGHAKKTVIADISPESNMPAVDDISLVADKNESVEDQLVAIIQTVIEKESSLDHLRGIKSYALAHYKLDWFSVLKKQTENGDTVLHKAVRANKLDVIDFLMESLPLWQASELRYLIKNNDNESAVGLASKLRFYRALSHVCGNTNK